MGTYLSTPVLDKAEESGETLKCPISPLAWGVVDMQGWRKSMEDAHVAATDIEVPLHLDNENSSHLKRHEGKVFGVFDGHGGPEVARFCQVYLVNVLTSMATWKEDSPNQRDAVGQALIACFHALDRMIDDPDRRDELVRLRSEKPSPGERRTAVIDLPPSFFEEPKPPLTDAALSEEAPNNDDNDKITPDTSQEEEKDIEQREPDNEGKKESSVEEPAATNSEEDETKDDDSTKAVGHENMQAEDDIMEDERGENGTAQEKDRALSIIPNDEGILEQVLDIGGGEQLSISRNAAGQVEIQVKDEDDDEDDDGPDDSKYNGPSASMPTLIHNGRQVCNLPDHAIHAGCTAVVAVLIGRTLTVANAGDSRAVLCREGGRAEPLSFDHKPSQDREMQRITKAGGFVNQFGRVNGNLNLSRSIGDLKYKQVPGLSPAEQMITAEPDIMQVTLQPKDEFFILGCDGIWDCLTNEQAIQYVRERIDSKTPTEIGAEMLDDIISEDPRATQGIGGDNMTIMIVDLQPETRSYR